MQVQVELQAWESAFFGKPIYRVALSEEASSAPSHASLFQGGESSRPLYTAKIPATALRQQTFLEQQGFELIETEVRFRLALPATKAHLTGETLFATEQDLPELQQLCGTAFVGSRFRPPYFSLAENQRFYRQWIENAVKGTFDRFCLIERAEDGRIKGAVTLRFNGDEAHIGLLAVSPHFQRQGVARRLLAAAQQQAVAAGCKWLWIATQQSNHNAVRLYQSIGAGELDRSHWLYKRSE